MKKIILGITAITLCICLSACGKGASATAITSLSNQLDTTSNTISEMSTISPAEINIEEDKSQDLSLSSKETQSSLLNEQYYRAEILEKTTQIKEKMSKDVKLSKNETAALKDLVLSLNKYTDFIANSKGEMQNSAKSISTMKKDVNKNKEKLGAKINRLACNSNIRSAYYENILQTLDQIETFFEDTEGLEETKTESRTSLPKNIDTYRNEEEQESTLPPETLPTRNNFGYGRWNRFNPMRNTDTYGPTLRNIDGYNGMYGYNNGFGYPGYYGRPMMPMGPNGAYGSNYYNRATSPNFGAIPVAVDTDENKTDEENNCEDCKPTETNESIISTNNIIKKMPKHEDDDRVVVAH